LTWVRIICPVVNKYAIAEILYIYEAYHVYIFMDYNDTEHDGSTPVVFEYNPIDTRSASSVNRTSNAIFDFKATDMGQPHIHSGNLSMRGVHLDDQTSHITVASERFAQQLDLNSIQEQNRFMDNGFDTTAEMTTLFLQSKKHVEEHNFNSIISTYLTFTHNSNLLARDVVNSFKRSIISSMKLADMNAVCESMNYELPQEGLIQFENRTENVYGDYSEWQKILQILSFDDEQIDEYLSGPESNFGHDLPTIKVVLDNLKQIGAEELSMTDSLKIYLLTNIKSIISLVAITAFLREAMPSTFNATEASLIFTATMADCPRFSHEIYSQDIAWFMKNMIVSPSFEEKVFFFMETKKTMLKWSQTEVAKANVGRVRLRYRVGVQSNLPQNNTIQDGNVSTPLSMFDSPTYGDNIQNVNAAPASHLSQMEEDSIQQWSLRARIPPAISHKSRLMSYVLMGQTAFADPSDAILKHFSNETDLASNIIQQKVFKPHTEVIIEFLRLLTVKVTEFDALTSFREECFTDFSYTDSKDLSWLRFLQLYIAIHHPQDIWPHVWKAFCGVMSHQVLIAVANFKKTHEYDMNNVAEICMRGDESSKRTVSTIS